MTLHSTDLDANRRNAKGQQGGGGEESSSGDQVSEYGRIIGTSVGCWMTESRLQVVELVSCRDVRLQFQQQTASKL